MDIDKLKAILRGEEELRLQRYRDSLGYWTIGYGHQRQDLPETCTLEQAEDWLHEDVLGAVMLAVSFCRRSALTENRKIVLACMAFQLGGRIWDFHNLRIALTEKDWDKAADEMLDSEWHKQSPARCERMAKMMREG